MNSNSVPRPSAAESSSELPPPRRKPKIPFWLSLGPFYVFAALFAADKYMQHRAEEPPDPAVHAASVSRPATPSVAPSVAPENPRAGDLLGCGFGDATAR